MDIYHLLLLLIGIGLGMSAVRLMLAVQDKKDYINYSKALQKFQEEADSLRKQVSRVSELDDLKKQFKNTEQKLDIRLQDLKSDLDSVNIRMKELSQKQTDYSEALEKYKSQFAEVSKNFQDLKKQLDALKAEKLNISDCIKCACVQNPDKKDHTSCWAPMLTGVR